MPTWKMWSKTSCRSRPYTTFAATTRRRSTSTSVFCSTIGMMLAVCLLGIFHKFDDNAFKLICEQMNKCVTSSENGITNSTSSVILICLFFLKLVSVSNASFHLVPKLWCLGSFFPYSSSSLISWFLAFLWLSFRVFNLTIRSSKVSESPQSLRPTIIEIKLSIVTMPSLHADENCFSSTSDVHFTVYIYIYIYIHIHHRLQTPTFWEEPSNRSQNGNTDAKPMMMDHGDDMMLRSCIAGETTWQDTPKR